MTKMSAVNVDYKKATSNLVIISILIWFITLCGCALFQSCCSLSFQNIMTSGQASDVVDSEPATRSDAKVDVQLPIKPI